MSGSVIDITVPAIAASARQNTILLVEDDERVRYALHFFLQHAGYEVIAAGSVAEAEKYITLRGSKNIAAIISDIHLDPVSKEPDGYAFFLRWTEEDPDLSFILISGDPASWDLPAVSAKDVCFLVKPFSFYDLVAAVRSLLTEVSAVGSVSGRQATN